MCESKRSKWKGPFVDPQFLRLVALWQKEKRRTVLNTRSRASTVLPVMVGLTIGIYNGKLYIPMLISEQMVGHKLGEFAPTRKYTVHARIVGGRLSKAK